jgi:hypothetical protein
MFLARKAPDAKNPGLFAFGIGAENSALSLESSF